jgi:type I restriction enzyme R subunit
VQAQSARYTTGLPDALPAWRRPLAFAYESTGVETRFTNGLDANPRSRPVFAFHKPETLAAWLADAKLGPNVSAETKRVAEAAPDYLQRGPTFLSRLQRRPPLEEKGLWAAQVKAIRNLETSLADNRPRSLIQMATGSGKTFTAISFIYRLIKFAGARRVLFLVDRGNLGDQTLKEFQQYASPYNNFKFTEEYIVQRLTSNTLDTTARVCICTIQRMYSMLKGQAELPEDLEEESGDKLASLFKKQRLRPEDHLPLDQRLRHPLAAGEDLIATLAEYQQYEEITYVTMHDLAVAICDALEKKTYLHRSAPAVGAAQAVAS